MALRDAPPDGCTLSRFRQSVSKPSVEWISLPEDTNLPCSATKGKRGRKTTRDDALRADLSNEIENTDGHNLRIGMG
jgi:hypothetical protein